MQNLATMTISKKKGSSTESAYTLRAIVLFILVRLLIVFISTNGTTPYLCYDDLNIYDKITTLQGYEIRHWFMFRNCYYWMCTILNQLRIGEYITGARLLNIALWLATCFQLKNIAQYFEYDKKTVKAIFFFMMVSPVYAIYSMVPLREVFCTWAVCSLICIFLKYEKEHKINWVITAAITVILFFIRTGVVEMLAIVIFAYEFRDGKWYVKVLLGVLAIAALAYFLTSSDYMYVINNKVANYLNSESSLTGFLSLLEVKKVTDIYKLVLLIPYVQMIPLPGAFETFYTANSWSAWVTMLAGIQSFILPYFWIYVFKKGKSKEEKVILVFYFITLIELALSQPNNSRFFFFTTPIFFLFGIKMFKEMSRKNQLNLLLGIVFAVIPYLYLAL